MRKTLIALVSLALLLSVAAAPVSAVKPIRDASPRHDSPDYNNGQALGIEKGQENTAQPPLGSAKVGQVRTWLGLDDFRGAITLKNYTLRGVRNHVEVWVANNLNFPNTSMLNPLTADPTDFFTYNDCRNDGVRNVISDSQVTYLMNQFDNNIYPTEADWWSIPPARDGHKALLPSLIPNLPSSEYKGEGDNIVVLVDNVRDDNFYDQNNANTLSYIAGFYYSVFDDYFNRTVMNIDAWDWLHRTTANPAHAPTTDPCTSAPARPFLYEGVFAHEYQHLLHRYTDPDEVNWVNEGLSDFTEVITGYADISKHVDEKGNDSHTQCYLGWLSVFEANWNPIPRACGPENSLTAWGDQGDDEILADYGFAMYFMNYVHSQGLDKDFFHSWQHDPGNGIDGMNSALATFGGGKTFQSLFNDEIISALADGYIDNGASVSGGTAAQFQNLAAEATIYPSTEMNGTPGAPPWGADYIDLGPTSGLASVDFNGDDQYFFPDGPQWVVDGDGYFTNPDVTGGVYDNNQDLSISIDATGHDGEVLSFDHFYETEPAWDFGFVQVSTDNGATWQSLACDGTTSEHDPGAIGSIVANMPGYTGPSGASAGSPLHATCPALPAGTDFVAFRLMSDPSVQFDGWHVKNIQLHDGATDTTPATWSTLANWDNQQFLSPVDLTFGFALVGITGTVDGFGDVTGPPGSVKVVRPTLGAGNTYTVTAGDLVALSGSSHVFALVWGIPASEDSTLYQPYSLMVNGAERHDGL